MLRFFSSRPNWDSPTPSHAGECVLPPPSLVPGGGTLACGRGVGGVPTRTRGHTLWYSLCILWKWLLHKSSHRKRPANHTISIVKPANTAKTNAENLKQIFPEKEYRGLSPNFHIHVSYMDRSWEYINRSQTHECGNWGWGRAIPRKRIYKRNCRCSGWWINPLPDLTKLKKEKKLYFNQTTWSHLEWVYYI